jgi:hypothetical protein
MNKRLWLYASVASIALVGCATMDAEIAKTGCQGVNCWVKVSITADCQFTFNPDRLVVPVPRGAKHIEWEIVSSPDFIFANTDGIKIKQPDGEFDNPGLDSSKKKFKLRNKHTKKKDYEYGANVVTTGANPKTCSKDPFIVNE